MKVIPLRRTLVTGHIEATSISAASISAGSITSDKIHPSGWEFIGGEIAREERERRRIERLEVALNLLVLLTVFLAGVMAGIGIGVLR